MPNKKGPPKPKGRPKKPCPQLQTIIDQNAKIVSLLTDLVNALTPTRRS